MESNLTSSCDFEPAPSKKAVESEIYSKTLIDKHM